MIYQISTQQLPLALSNGSEIIIISSNSTNALIRSTNITDLNIIKEYNDDKLSELLLSDFWQQPCTNC
jgi:hypothetical protein